MPISYQIFTIVSVCGEFKLLLIFPSSYGREAGVQKLSVSEVCEFLESAPLNFMPQEES
jgi:hypothetical protein